MAQEEPITPMKGMRDLSGKYMWTGKGDPNDPASWVPAPAESGKWSPHRGALGILQGIRDPIDAGAQMLPRGLASLTSAFGAAPNRLSAFLDREAQDVDAGIKANEAQYQQKRQAAGGAGIDVGRIAGNMVPTVAGSLAAGGIPIGASLLSRIGIGTLAGGGFGALQPVTDGNFAEEKAKQIATGAALGGATPVVTGALARVIKPAVSGAVGKLRKEGIYPTIGQSKGGIVGALEEKTQSIPLVGDVITSAKNDVTLEMNKAAWNRTLAPIGKALPKNVTGREAVNFVDDAIDDAYGAVLGKIGPQKVDSQLVTELSTLHGMLNTLPKARGEQYAAIIKNEIVDRVQHGRITPEAIKMAESNLGHMIRQFGRANDADQLMLGQALREAQASLRSWLSRSAGKDVGNELKAVNTAYANFLRPLRAASSSASIDGNFSASQLHQAVRALDPSKHKKDFASGGALMQDLSDPAKSVLSNRVPNSGSAERGMLGYMLANPVRGLAAAGPAMLASIPYSAGGRRLGALMTQRPGIAAPVAGAVRGASPYLPPGMLAFLRERALEEQR